MANTDMIIQYLKQNGLAWCDDCLSDKTGISPRQQIYQLGSKLAKTGVIFRDKGRCAGCGKIKTVSSSNPNISYAVAPSPCLTKSEVKPWYWEGNIQAVLASHLAKNGYKIMSIANTAARERGKDIEAVTPEGKNCGFLLKAGQRRAKILRQDIGFPKVCLTSFGIAMNLKR